MEYTALAAEAVQEAVDGAVAARAQRRALAAAVIAMAGPPASCDHVMWRCAPVPPLCRVSAELSTSLPFVLFHICTGLLAVPSFLASCDFR